MPICLAARSAYHSLSQSTRPASTLRQDPILELTLVAAFLIGLASALHCVGMCGGIIGALSFSLPEPVRTQRPLLLGYLLAYNGGRVASYTLAGSLVGALGSGLFDNLSPTFGHQVLRLLAAVLLVGIGLYLAGWFPRFAQLERIGVPLWKRLEPLGQKLLPVRSPLQAFGFGLVWGWLPCGLVYSTLLWSASSGSGTRGALTMLMFGLGTLPAVLATGLLAGWITRIRQLPAARAAIGISLIAFGLASLWFSPDHSEHTPQTHDHSIHDQSHESESPGVAEPHSNHVESPATADESERR